MDATNKGHGRLERRKVWVSEQLCGYSEFPGLASVIKIAKRVEYLKDGRVVQSVQYAVSSLSELSPSRAARTLEHRKQPVPCQRRQLRGRSTRDAPT